MSIILEILHQIFLPVLDYNTKVVLLGVIVYSIGCVLIGNFLILQRRSLLADVLSHTTFPGIMVLFVLMLMLGWNSISKNLFVLLLGAVFTTMLAVFVITKLQKHTVLKQDAIQASVLSLFFGLGVAILGIAQRMPTGSTAGMFTFIYGNTASMQRQDMLMFVALSLLIIFFLIVRSRQMTIFCFDTEYAQTIGINSKRLDFLMLSLVMLQVIIGIQAIGLLMVSAIFIIPVVIGKFWSNRLGSLIVLSVIVSAVSGYVGAILSANSVNFPTGAVIVTVMECVFIFSLLFGTKKGIVTNFVDREKFVRKMNMEHILRTIREYIELNGKEKTVQVHIDDVYAYFHGHLFTFKNRLRYIQRQGNLVLLGNRIELTPKGYSESARILRNHRLWEAYLLYYTSASSDNVDYSADRVEHILGLELTTELEHKLRDVREMKASELQEIPPSPHVLTVPERLVAEALEEDRLSGVPQQHAQKTKDMPSQASPQDGSKR